MLKSLILSIKYRETSIAPIDRLSINCENRYSNFACIVCSENFISAFVVFISSPELKAQVSFFDWLVFVVRPLSVCKFFSFSTGLISTNLDTKQYWVKGVHVYSNDVLHPFQREDN